MLRGRFGRPYFYLERCETTQRMLDAAQPEGAVAVCEEQTAGRGRMGRLWEAPAASSILVSVLLRPPRERRAAELTLVAGVATAIAVERATGLTAQIKWPNDIMLDRRKVAGGLAELKDGAVVLGIGLNVNQKPGELPSETKVPAGSLRSVTGREYERVPILADLLLELEHRYDAWRNGGLNVNQKPGELPSETKVPAGSLRSVTGREYERGPILADLLLELEQRYDAWRNGGLDGIYEDLGARDFLRGRRVTVDGVAGTSQLITRDGRLEISTDSGQVLVESGEVLFER